LAKSPFFPQPKSNLRIGATARMKSALLRPVDGAPNRSIDRFAFGLKSTVLRNTDLCAATLQKLPDALKGRSSSPSALTISLQLVKKPPKCTPSIALICIRADTRNDSVAK
jgi:hypothetical protein